MRRCRRQERGHPRRRRRPRRARSPSWSTPPGCPAPPRTGWPSPSRCTACSPATPRAASCSARGVGELAAALPDPLITAAGPVLAWVRDECGESAQLYRRDGAERVCVAAAERAHGLRTTVPVGHPPAADGRLGRAGARARGRIRRRSPACCAPPSSPRAPLAEVRRRGWAQSVGQREAGVASVSAPVLARRRRRCSPRSRSPARSSGSAAPPGSGSPRCSSPARAASPPPSAEPREREGALSPRPRAHLSRRAPAALPFAAR